MTSKGMPDIQLRRSRQRATLASGPGSVMTLRTPRSQRAVQFVDRSGLFLDVEHLPAAITARFQIDVMRPAKLAGVLVLDISRRRQGVVGPPVAPLHARGFSFGNSHGANPYQRPGEGGGAFEPALIGAIASAGQGPM